MALTFILVLSCLVFTFNNAYPVQPYPEEIIVESYKPYDFGYEFGDGLGMSQYRKESADENGIVQGHYGYIDPAGLYRSVEYKADSNGFHAVVKSNEPGLSNQNSADVTFIVEPPPPEVVLKSNLSNDLLL